MSNEIADFHIISDRIFDKSRFFAAIFARDFQNNVIFVSDVNIWDKIIARVDFDNVCGFGVIFVGRKEFKTLNCVASPVRVAQNKESCWAFLIVGAVCKDISAAAAVKRSRICACRQSFVWIGAVENGFSRARRHIGKSDKFSRRPVDWTA